MIFHTARFDIHVQREIDAAREGGRPDIEEDNDWYGRAPPDDEFQRRRNRIETRGLLCRVRLWVSGNNNYPEHPLLGLQVEPIEPSLMNEPATHSGVWHISVAFHSPENRELERAFVARYGGARTVRLLFTRVEWNAVCYLDPVRDPIASDPVVQNLQRASYYHDRPLHITF